MGRMRCALHCGTLFLIVHLVTPQTMVTNVHSTVCTGNEFYDTGSFSCIECQDTTNATADRRGCKCTAGYILTNTDLTTYAITPPCEPCSETASFNRFFCMTCDASTLGYNSTDRECTCPDNFGLVETDEAGTYQSYKSCVNCTLGTYLGEDGFCTPCSDPRMTATYGACECSVDYVQFSDVCLHTETAQNVQASYPTSTAYVVSYPDVVSAAGAYQSSVTSAVLSKWFYEAAVKCKRAAGVEWCQMLANMCVLNMYAKSAPACALFISLTSGASFNDFNGWSPSVGFLYFENMDTVLSDTNLTTQYTFLLDDVSDTTAHTLSIKLAAYAFNGTFLGWQDLSTQLALCGGAYESIMEWTHFGTWKLTSCDIDINRFVRENDTIFYDPFYVEADGSYYPMPVIIENYRDLAGDTPNAESNTYFYKKEYSTAAVATRRFMIVDNLSGRISGFDSSPDVVRILSSAGIVVETRNPDEPDKIYPPRLVLKYAEIDIKNLDATTKYTIYTEFGISYKMDLDTIKISFRNFLIVTMILAGLLGGLRIYRFSKAYHGNFNVGHLLNNLGILSRAIGHTFGVSYIIFAFYYYASFKMSGTVTTLIPSNDDISWELYWYWGVAFTSVFLGTIHQIVIQLGLEARTFCRTFTLSMQVPVSTWRILFVANEWARLQTERLIDFDNLCMWVLFFIAGVPASGAPYYNANCNTPDGDFLDDCTDWARSDLLRICVDAFFWIVVGLWQVGYTKLVYQRWFKDNTAQLLDVLSLANISAWVLSSKYEGYYLHGQSSLQHSDTTLAEFSQLLANEGQSRASMRGLLSGSEMQEFIMFVSKSSRDKNAKIDESESTAFIGQMRQEFGSLRRNRLTKPGSNAHLDSKKAVNGLLRNFVKLMQTVYRDTHVIELSFIKRLLHIPPDPDSYDHATLWHDNNHTWTSVFFEGIEFDLILLNIYMFTLFDILFGQPCIAMLLTYFFQKGIDLLRHESGIQKLAKTTLIGERFFL